MSAPCHLDPEIGLALASVRKTALQTKTFRPSMPRGEALVLLTTLRLCIDDAQRASRLLSAELYDGDPS